MADGRREGWSEAVAAGFCADLLAMGRPLDGWSTMLAFLAFAVPLLGGEVPVIPLLLSLAPAMAAKCCALRVRLDEAVFRRWAADWMRADGPTPAASMAAFDLAIGRRVDGRSLASRCLGARRWLNGQVLATLLQTAWVAVVALCVR